MTGVRLLALLCSLALLVGGAALAVVLVACGSSKSAGPPQGDAASDAPDGGDSGPATTGVGVVTFSELPDSGGTFFAGFSETVPTLGPNCTAVDAGPCVTTSCMPPPPSDAGSVDAGPADASTAPAPSAGTMTITGGVFGAKGSALAPDKAGTYVYASPGTIFAPGDTLGVSAAGGAVPAFPTQTVIATPTIVLTAPTPGAGGKMTIPTAQPLVVSWTGGQAGAKTVLVATAVFTTGGAASTTCSWDASLGTGTVPSAALAPLAAANAETSGVSWYQSADEQFTVGTLAVTVSARVTQGSLASFQ
ncbi:MAG TPA: hypothetical protein VGL81_36830 [Polyangiaceae bacterium]